MKKASKKTELMPAPTITRQPELEIKPKDSVSLFEVEQTLTMLSGEYMDACTDLAAHDNVETQDGALQRCYDAQTALEEATAVMLDGAQSKRDHVARFLLSLEAREAALTKEAARINKRKHTVSNQLENFRNYVLLTMQANGVDTLHGDVHTLKMTNNRPSVEVLDEAAVPHEWRKPPVPGALDKVKIKGYLMESAIHRAKVYKERFGEEIKKENYGKLLLMSMAQVEGNEHVYNAIPGVELVTDKKGLKVT